MRGKKVLLHGSGEAYYTSSLSGSFAYRLRLAFRSESKTL